MKRLIDDEEFDKIVLVSWDWDYIKPVKYLIEKWKFKKILFPNKRYSSLYNQLKTEHIMNLWNDRIKKLISYRKNKQKKRGVWKH